MKKVLYGNQKVVQTVIHIPFGEKEGMHMQKAKVGNVIEFKEGLQGIVEKVNENSVIVDLTYMDNYRELELEEKTVVNHKNYKIIKETAL